MFKKFLPHISYYLFWIVFFAGMRAMFMLYHFGSAAELSSATIAKAFWVGLRMDASFAAYISIAPFLLFFLKTVFPRFRVSKIIRIYTGILVVLLVIVSVADLELYTAWGYRMDATPLQYFLSPKEMAGTVSSAPIWILLVLIVVASTIFVFLMRFFILPPEMRPMTSTLKVLVSSVSFFLIALLFIPIRGGIQKIPLNVSDAYFTDNLFANHAALNLPWNVMFSILNRNSPDNPFDFFDPATAHELFSELQSRNASPGSLLSVEKPNVILIILESFTAKLMGSLGGERGVTPQLDSIAADGLLFTNFYASGDRSEKGQSSILSGYPNQAINSIIKMPTKTRELPSLCNTLESYGYSCSYTYGGELEFANIKSYLINTGYRNLVSKYSFPASLRTTSWGVHDEYVFNRFYSDLKKEKEPFFATIFSLSSHEPFDVPLLHFKGKDRSDLFRNSVYYTDSVLGDFIQKLKKETYWNRTLVVIVSDHGHPLPGDDPNDAPSKFHVPLIFTGGALNKKGIVTTYGSQTDIATTVLNQLKIPSPEFIWGNDLLDSSRYSFAFYNFNNGFGWVDQSGFVTVDNVTGKVIRSSPGFDSTSIKYGKAYMQVSYQDYLDR